MEGFGPPCERHVCRFSPGVLATTAKKSSRDEFINASFVGSQRVGRNIIDRVDWRMSLIIVAACARLAKGSIKKASKVSLRMLEEDESVTSVSIAPI